MRRFTTPCFVRVENPQERKELIVWLKSLGYGCLSRSGTAIIAFGNLGLCAGVPHERLSSHLTIAKRDCGTNTRLFKALAAMNDENDREQWIICESGFAPLPPERTGTMRFCRDSFDRIDMLGCVWRKATAEEIIEHFKTR